MGRSRALMTLLLLVISIPSWGADPRIEPDVVYGHKDGLAMTFDVYYPEDDPHGGAVVFLVSGGWVSRWSPPDSLVPLLEPYLQRGYVAFAVRHGSSPRYGISDAVSDVRRAIRFLRTNADRFQIDPDRMGVMGISAGGHLALMLATTGDDGIADSDDPVERAASRVRTAVALVPPSDLRIMVWEAEESLPIYRNFPALNLDVDQAAELSPLLHVSPESAPALIIAGGRDELVPPKHAQWIHDAFEEQGSKSELIVYPEAGHGLDGGAREKAVDEIVRWFEDQLR